MKRKNSPSYLRHGLLARKLSEEAELLRTMEILKFLQKFRQNVSKFHH
jgi:hypothetical protein